MLTRQGWVCLSVGVAFIAAGRVLGARELFALGAVMLVLVVACGVYVYLRKIRIDITRELHPPRVFAGTPSRVDLRVENRSRTATPVLGLRDAVSGTRGASLLVAPLSPGGVVRAAYRLPTDRRGVLEIGPLRASMEDPFGMARVWMQASGVSELTVYPQIDEIPPVPQTTGNDPMAGAEHPNALGRSGDDFYALRPYVLGDDLRRVHWPSTARHDDLMVRQDELPWQGRATVFLDARSTTVAPEALELAVSAAASIVNASTRRQDLVRLVTSDGIDSGFAAGHAHVEAIMEHLAALELSHDTAFRRVVDQMARSATGGALIVVCAEASREEIERFSRLRNRFGSVTIVQFERSSWDPRAASPAPAAHRDGVLRVTRERGFVDVWSRSMRRSSRRHPIGSGVRDSGFGGRVAAAESIAGLADEPSQPDAFARLARQVHAPSNGRWQGDGGHGEGSAS